MVRVLSNQVLEKTIQEGEGPSMMSEGTIKSGSHIGPPKPIIGPGVSAAREANFHQAKGNHHGVEFRRSWGIDRVNTKFFPCRGDSIKVPNNSPGVMGRKGRRAEVLP